MLVLGVGLASHAELAVVVRASEGQGVRAGGGWERRRDGGMVGMKSRTVRRIDGKSRGFTKVVEFSMTMI